MNQAVAQLPTVDDTEVNDLVEAIQKICCKKFVVPFYDILGKTRKREAVLARQTAMHFVKEFTNYTLKQIGYRFGERDHSTVIHALVCVEEMTETDRKYKLTIEGIEMEVKEIIKNGVVNPVQNVNSAKIKLSKILMEKFLLSPDDAASVTEILMLFIDEHYVLKTDLKNAFSQIEKKKVMHANSAFDLYKGKHSAFTEVLSILGSIKGIQQFEENVNVK
jgi:hypothetical protein